MNTKRKDFNKIFSQLTTENKKIWAVSTVKELHNDIIDIAVRLLDLDFIHFVKITNQTITASSQIKETTKQPIARMNHLTAIGIEILYHCDYKVLDFFETNSPVKGNGSKMVSAVLRNLPESWSLAVVMDWSDGFWEKIKEKHCDREWIL